MATPFDLSSRYGQILSKYGELTELLKSSGYELTIDDTDIDISVTGGQFLFTLDTLTRTDI